MSLAALAQEVFKANLWLKFDELATIEWTKRLSRLMRVPPSQINEEQDRITSLDRNTQKFSSIVVPEWKLMAEDPEEQALAILHRRTN